MKKSKGLIHSVALAAVFSVGNSLLRYPWRADRSELLLRFCLTLLCALLPAILFYPLFQRLYRAPLSRHPVKASVAAAVSLLLILYAFLCAWQVLSDYLAYSTEMILTDSHKWLLAAGFLFAAAYLACIPKKSLGVCALVFFVGTTLCVLLLFAFGVRHFRAEYIPKSVFGSSHDRFSNLPSLVWDVLLPLLLLSAYFALTLPKRGGRAMLIGSGIGYGLLLLCVLQALLTFGAGYSAELSYPYSYAVRVISIGPYFFRLEGFSYLLDFAACLLRLGVSLAAARRLLGRFLPRLSSCLPPIAAVLLLLLFFLY